MGLRSGARERFLSACLGAPTDRVPAWAMRQAGRYLPEYRALKEKYGFSALVHEPELAAEATLQPIRRFPELDAAILFNDILSVPEALGQGYAFRDGGGIAMDFTLDSAEKIRALGSPEDVPARLDFAARALRLVRAELGGSRALLGFAGSPWTLAVYMVEGGSARQFTKIKRLAAEEPALFDALMEKLSDAVAASLNLQISAGADAVQIFDSWAALCPAAEYERLSLRWMRRVSAALPTGVPVIIFAKGMAHFAREIADAGAQVLGVDWTRRLSDVRRISGPRLALQGNLDPAVLCFSDERVVRSRVREILDEMRGERGFIFNLGHGISPDAKPENLASALDEIASA